MQTATIPLKAPLLRGAKRPRVALIGRARTGKSTIFQVAAAVAVKQQQLAGTTSAASTYDECVVNLGLEQISLVDLPPLDTLHQLQEVDRVVLKYILWGDRWPTVPRHEAAQPTAFAEPDVLIQVVDATALERDLELTLSLTMLGRPLVVALNRMDEARDKGLFINVRALAERLGVPVVPTVAHMGKGVADLFAAALEAARGEVCPLPQPLSPHIATALAPIEAIAAQHQVCEAFRVPRTLLATQLAENDDWFMREIEAHFPALVPEVLAARAAAAATLPRALPDELHADRHHRAALLFEAVTSLTGPMGGEAGWRGFLDALFLHPRWGLFGSLAIFGAVLFIVFELAGVLDSYTSAQLAAWVQTWQPVSTVGIVGRAVAEGLVGLVGIVVPYMLPLVVLLVLLEQSGIMHRVAFVVDRGFHRIGLHGAAALPFLIGLGCNVPAISAAAKGVSGRDRILASLLVTFVPCSARSAIILALGGKYLGAPAVLALFLLTPLVIALLGRLLAKRYTGTAPGMVLDIPPYRWPSWRPLLRDAWDRTSDIVTIVTPLLVAGSVLLALLSHIGADDYINLLLTPITGWWLGLPVALGVPILFGVLRKELSLLMVAQALGTEDIASQLDTTQIFTFLVFLTFYVPCVSTFAVMLKTVGRREAWFSVALSVAVALLLAGAARLLLGLAHVAL